MTGFVCSMLGTTVAAAAAARTAKTITAVGNAQVDTAQSKFGGASALFDGTGDRLTVTSNADFAFSGDFTIEFWIRFTARTGTTNYIIFDGRLSTDGSVVKPTIYHIDNSIRLFVNGADRIVSSTLTITNGVWYHVAVSRSGTSTKLFWNGTQEGSTYTDSNSYVQTAFSIGDYAGTGFGVNGHMDEIRISKNARYTANFTAPTAAFTNDSNTVLLLHCDGTDASTTFTDDTGVRSPKGISAIGNAQVDTAQSKFGGASALFDGTGDYLTVNPVGTDLYFPAGQDVTIEMWIRPNVTQQFNPFFGLGNARGASSGEVSLYIESFGGQFYLRMAYNYGAVLALTSAGGAIASNNWYHIAYSREGDVHRLFLNGALQETETDAGLNLGVSGQGCKIGSWADASGFYTGHIDEVRISNIARYTANFTAPTAAFTNDANTLFLCHANGTNGSTTFTDDNA